MEFALTVLFSRLASIAAVLSAAWLAHDGAHWAIWSVFLVVSLLHSSDVRFSNPGPKP